jgi:hypothetical protein
MQNKGRTDFGIAQSFNQKQQSKTVQKKTLKQKSIFILFYQGIITVKGFGAGQGLIGELVLMLPLTDPIDRMMIFSLYSK